MEDLVNPYGRWTKEIEAEQSLIFLVLLKFFYSLAFRAPRGQGLLP